jgi:hypothetical protein
MKKHVVLASIVLFMSLPAAGVAAEAASQPGSGDQRAACDAQCRENYQNNSAAMEACLRDCGAVGPASPAAMAPGHEATHTAQQASKVKGSKSNSSERLAAPPPEPVEGTTVKGSKSNSDNRLSNPPGPPPVPVETSNLNLSKSNIDRVAPPSGAGVQPAEATTVKSSKSNSSEGQPSPGTEETPPLDPEGEAPADG